MATKAAKVDSLDKEWRREVSFNFGKGGMQEPEGFSDLTIDQEVTVLVTGKVSNVHLNADESGFRLQMDKVELQTGTKGGLGEALKKAKKSQKVKTIPGE